MNLENIIEFLSHFDIKNIEYISLIYHNFIDERKNIRVEFDD